MNELNSHYNDNTEFGGNVEINVSNPDINREGKNYQSTSSFDGEFVVGNVTKPIKIGQNPDFSEVRADIEVKTVKTIRVWGQIKDCNNVPVKNALLKLVKKVKECDQKFEYVGVAHGVTDCLGFYQFDICVPKNSIPDIYRILVSKQALGKEISMNLTECSPCKDKFICAR